MSATLLTQEKYRLVTRSDFDGLVCAVLLKERNLIGEIRFVHPKDMQDGKIEISAHDITTNLPYVPGVHLAFDHHASEATRNIVENRIDNNRHIIIPEAPSAARVVYDYFGGAAAFPEISEEMMTAVDQADSAQFSLEDILQPTGWVLLNFIMDARTGLGRFKEFRISNYQLMMNLIDCCKNLSIKEILNLPDVKERTDLYFDHQESFIEQIKRCSTIYDNFIVIDLRFENIIYAGNRFMVYALFPECNISAHLMWGLNQQNIVFAVGKSILNRTSKINIGELMLLYCGGGHANAGTCQITNELAETVMLELVTRINIEG
ncbi:MAG: exopolyphosphatase [Synechococcales cyanobacterium CRU_2_2]|nr:exopolyphosphatase [Synechococcales cyanobacterium CRU_2_2]